MELETETGKTVITCARVSEDNEGHFAYFPKSPYNVKIRLSEKDCVGIITGYLKPKKENK